MTSGRSNRLFARLTIRGVFILLVGGSLALFGSLWVWFHSIPTQADLQQMLRSADTIEIFRWKDDAPRRWVRLTDPSLWADLADRLRFRATFWQFSTAPTDALVIQVFQQDRRFGAWEVRADGCVHLRKAVRWYRLPVEPGFAERLQQLLDERGADLPAADPEPSPSTNTSESS